ncbi:hypothetical protein [Streptomyces sp. NPDC007917]|uniref:hypothetical protein n=1 Tax=Streptomyces sp. NPDC007917 TaxID=3364793 RepID=UPI0036E458C8
MSRYLNGTVVAPAEFVDTLLTHAAKATGRPSSPEVITHVHGLQRRALQATNRSGWELQNLRDQLADADRRRQQAEVRAEALQARKQRIAEVTPPPLKRGGFSLCRLGFATGQPGP